MVSAGESSNDSHVDQTTSIHPKNQITGSPLLRCQVDGKLQTLGEAEQNVIGRGGNPVVLDMDVLHVYCMHVHKHIHT